MIDIICLGFIMIFGILCGLGVYEVRKNNEEAIKSYLDYIAESIKEEEA